MRKTSMVALLVTCCMAPALVLGQTDKEKEDRAKARAKQNAPKAERQAPRNTPPPAAQKSEPAGTPDQPRRRDLPTIDNNAKQQPRPGREQVNQRERSGNTPNNPPNGQPNNQPNNRPNTQSNTPQNNFPNNTRPNNGRDNNARDNRPNQPNNPRTNQPNNQPNTNGARRTNDQPRQAFRPPSNAATTTRNDGGAIHRAPDGRQWETNRGGQVTHFSNGNTDVRLRDNGRISTLRVTRPDRTQVIVNRSVHGERRVEVVRTDRTRVVTFGPRAGFVERPFRAGYVSRTYVVSGRPVAYVYHTQVYRGVTFYHYVPPVYYAPVFYRWAWNPWATPVVYSWGWRSDPWYGYYGGYFAPAPSYATAALFLTDFLLAENLRLAYDQRQAVPANDYYDPGPSQVTQSTNVALSPEVKQAIAEEVRLQLSEMQNSNGQPTALNDAAPPAALDPNQRIFVVSMALDVNTRGQECALTPGDIILRSGDALNGTKVGITVLNSKAGDCAVNSSAEIEAADLQEMHNQFREKIDSGMAVLASNQGKDGIPSSPAPAPRTVEGGTAEADANASRLLQQQQQEAGTLEDEARRNALDGN